MIGLLALGAAPAAQEPAEVLEQARSDLDREALVPARRGFEAVLASEPSYWHPLAEIGLATLLRLDGRPGAGLTRLEPPRRRLEAWLADPATTNEVVLQGQRELHEEAGRCLLALGVLDRAAAEFSALERCCRRSEPAERFLAGLAWIDLHLAQRDHRRAIARCELLVSDPAVRAAVPGAEAALAPRLAAARLRNGADRTTAGAIAAQLQGWFATAAPGTARHRLLGLELVDAHALAGADEEAFAVASAMVRGPFENAQRETEIRARHARLALGRQLPRPQLTELRQGLESSFSALLRDWAETPLRRGGVGTLQFDARLTAVGTLLAIDRELAVDGDVQSAFDHLESVLAMGTLARQLGAKRVSVETVRRDLVAKDRCVLAVLLTMHHAHLLWIAADECGHQSVPLDIAFWEQANTFVKQVVESPDARSRSAVEGLRQLGDQLRSRLFRDDLMQRLGAHRHLVLIGAEDHGSLLQALPWGGGWFATKFAITHSASAALAAALQQRMLGRAAQPRALDELILAAPKVLPEVERRFGIEPLRLDEEQRRRLVGGPDNRRIRIELGPRATYSALRRGAADANLVCVVGHGLVDPSREHAAGIALAPDDGHDGLLHGDQLARIALPSVILLGVCRASAGPGRRGDDGMSHLGGSCLSAGSDCVVLADGELPVNATVDLLGAILGGLRSGLTVAESLRRARAEMAQSENRMHPYFFAGLRATGIDRRLRD